MKKTSSSRIASVSGALSLFLLVGCFTHESKSPSAPLPEGEIACSDLSNAETAFPCRQGEMRVGMLQLENGEEEIIEYEYIDGHAIFQGDIYLQEVPPDETAGTLAKIASMGRVRFGTKWINNIVPYTLDPLLENPARVNNALAHWRARSLVGFVLRTTEMNFVTFSPGELRKGPWLEGPFLKESNRPYPRRYGW